MIVNMGQLLALFYVIKIFIYIKYFKTRLSLKFAKTPTCFGHNLTILRECKNSCNEVATIFLPVVWRHAFVCSCYARVL